MNYTTHQQAYINSVHGQAHQSAVAIIGMLDTQMADLKESHLNRTTKLLARLKDLKRQCPR